MPTIVLEKGKREDKGRLGVGKNLPKEFQTEKRVRKKQACCKGKST